MCLDRVSWTAPWTSQGDFRAIALRDTFAHSGPYYAPDINVDHYIQILEELGAHCDCEIATNVYAKYA